MKFCNVFVHNTSGRTQQNFTHVTTVTLSWHVQNFVVISWAHFKQEHYKFWSNFKFRNMVSGMGTKPGSQHDLCCQSSRPGSKSASFQVLTHWGRVTHICLNKLTIISSDNGLSPGRRQAIIWTNAGILLIGPLGTNFSEILIEI